jgi:hypothetical protein
MGIFLPDGFEPLTALHVAEVYGKIIDGMNKTIYFDYKNILEFTPNSNVFSLDYIPVFRSLSFFINGIKYYENVHYTLDREGKLITWLSTEDEGGFDLQPHFKYLALYDIDIEENSLESIEDIV